MDRAPMNPVALYTADAPRVNRLKGLNSLTKKGFWGYRAAMAEYGSFPAPAAPSRFQESP
jgi:hypothetical protein